MIKDAYRKALKIGKYVPLAGMAFDLMLDNYFGEYDNTKELAKKGNYAGAAAEASGPLASSFTKNVIAGAAATAAGVAAIAIGGPAIVVSATAIGLGMGASYAADYIIGDNIKDGVRDFARKVVDGQIVLADGETAFVTQQAQLAAEAKAKAERAPSDKKEPTVAPPTNAPDETPASAPQPISEKKGGDPKRAASYSKLPKRDASLQPPTLPSAQTAQPPLAPEVAEKIVVAGGAAVVAPGTKPSVVAPPSATPPI